MSKGAKRTPPEVRFMTKIDTTDPDKCWVWQDRLDKDGYGFIGRGGKYGGQVRAHRFSYQMHYGVDPGELFVCHKCDNPSCVNPHHLFLGDYSANNKDSYSKGRNPNPIRRGEDSQQSRLTEDDVRTLRHRYATEQVTQQKLAEEYGISQVAVGCIIRRKTWSHIT
jgi:hypothetical protein